MDKQNICPNCGYAGKPIGCVFNGDCLPAETRVCNGCPYMQDLSTEQIQQVKRIEWRRIFKQVHLTRKQVLSLPMDIRQDIMIQQVDNYLNSISDEEKLKELHKLD